MKVTKNSINGKPYHGYFFLDNDYSCLYDYCEDLESYIEIGTAHGMSACVAGFAVTGDVHCIDPFKHPKGWQKFGNFPMEIVRQNWANMGHDPERLHIYPHATPPLPRAVQNTFFDVGLIDGKHGPFGHVISDVDALGPHITKYLLIHDIHKERRDASPRHVFDWVVEHDPDWELETIRGCMGVLKRV